MLFKRIYIILKKNIFSIKLYFRKFSYFSSKYLEKNLKEKNSKMITEELYLRRIL